MHTSNNLEKIFLMKQLLVTMETSVNAYMILISFFVNAFEAKSAERCK